MSVEKYLFWYQVQRISKNLEKVLEYREDNWTGNFFFNENLNVKLDIVNKCLRGK